MCARYLWGTVVCNKTAQLQVVFAGRRYAELVIVCVQCFYCSIFWFMECCCICNTTIQCFGSSWSPAQHLASKFCFQSFEFISNNRCHQHKNSGFSSCSVAQVRLEYDWPSSELAEQYMLGCFYCVFDRYGSSTLWFPG